MARCVIGLGGPKSSSWPFLRRHVGRAFVEHVAEAQGFGPWRPVSVALADFAEHGSGVVLCRLWPDCTEEELQAQQAARQALKYLGVRAPQHFVLAHAETRKACGRLLVQEGPQLAPAWAKPVIRAVSPEYRPGVPNVEQPTRLVFGAARATDRRFKAFYASFSEGETQPMPRRHEVGGPSRSNLAPQMDRFGDSKMSGREAMAILQSAFPAAYEWLLKPSGSLPLACFSLL